MRLQWEGHVDGERYGSGRKTILYGEAHPIGGRGRETILHG